MLNNNTWLRLLCPLNIFPLSVTVDIDKRSSMKKIRRNLNNRPDEKGALRMLFEYGEYFKLR